MLGLDDEELWFADFIHQRGVEPQPSFMDPITYQGGYDNAVSERALCRTNLKTLLKALKEQPLELGKSYFISLAQCESL